jgi:hypothetical protein
VKAVAIAHYGKFHVIEEAEKLEEHLAQLMTDNEIARLVEEDMGRRAVSLFLEYL